MRVTVEVFTTQSCPHCARAGTLVTEVIAALGKDNFELRVLDVVEELDHAVASGVLRTPAIAINGTLAFTGLPSAESLRRSLREATSSALQPGSSTCRNIA